MLWLRKKGAARSVAFSNVRDAIDLSFTVDEPYQVDATMVRHGTVSVISTSDEGAVERARALVDKGGSWVPVVAEAKWDKWVNLDQVTNVVLEDDPPPGATRGVRKLVLSVTYTAPATPYSPQSLACGEIHERNVIQHVLHHMGHGEELAEIEEEIIVEVSGGRRPKRKARP